MGHKRLAGIQILKGHQQRNTAVDKNYGPVAGGAGFLLNLPVPLVQVSVFLLALF